MGGKVWEEEEWCRPMMSEGWKWKIEVWQGNENEIVIFNFQFSIFNFLLSLFFICRGHLSSIRFVSLSTLKERPALLQTGIMFQNKI